MNSNRANNAAADVLAASASARAIDRVLQAERDAQAAVAACEQSSVEIVDAARQQARRIVERATARSVELHGRAARNLERCAAALLEQRMKTAAAAVKQLTDPARRIAAIDRLIERLTSASSNGT